MWDFWKIIPEKLGIVKKVSYVYYVMRDNPYYMNPSPLLLDERYDETIIEGMMYQPLNQEMKIIPRNSKDLEESIYELLSHIETFNNVKL